MSTYGTNLVVDVAPDGDVAALVAHLDGWLPVRRDLADGWTRVIGAHADVGLLRSVGDAARAAGRCRVAVAEDNDEYGAQWAVLEVVAGVGRVVHRRYVLAADPTDRRQVRRALKALGTDPRTDDVPGEEAAAAAALLFGTDPAAMRRAERESATAFREIGVVGGPFPWWDALGLPWFPDGEPLGG